MRRGAYFSYFHFVLSYGILLIVIRERAFLHFLRRDSIVYLSSSQPFYARRASRRARARSVFSRSRLAILPIRGYVRAPPIAFDIQTCGKTWAGGDSDDDAARFRARTRARPICSARPFINSFDWMDKAPR